MVFYCFWKSLVKYQGHRSQGLFNFNLISPFPDDNSNAHLHRTVGLYGKHLLASFRCLFHLGGHMGQTPNRSMIVRFLLGCRFLDFFGLSLCRIIRMITIAIGSKQLNGYQMPAFLLHYLGSLQGFFINAFIKTPSIFGGMGNNKVT